MNARRRKKKVRISPWAWIVLPAVFFVVFGAGMYVGLRRQSAAPSSSAESSGRRAHETVPSGVLPDAGSAVESQAPVTVSPSPRAPRSSRAGSTPVATSVARVALVIDDLGRSLEEVDAIRALGVPVTYSVLPYEVRTPQVVARLQRDGVEFLCHMPMEPGSGADPGPGALMSSMSRHQLRKAVRAALSAVPGAAGVNNHMGSVLTADPRAMEIVLKTLAKQDLFFLDSRTSADSLGYKTARRLGVPAVERQVFLDPDPAPQAIAFQFNRLLDIARLNGAAVGIGHPHHVTLEVLAQKVPLAQEKGIEFVPVSALLDRDHEAAD